MSKTPQQSLFRNTGALLSIQIANYVLPLLLIPYLTRVLGVSLYGVIAFGLSLVQIACIITDYGFGLSATYQIAQNTENKEAQRKISCAVLICKSILILPVMMAMAAFITLDSKYTNYHLYFWLLLLPIAGQTFQPIWFFQGVERMFFITAYSVSARLLYLILIIILVSQPSDNYYVAIANGVSSISSAIIGLGAMIWLGYAPMWCGWKQIISTFKDSTEFFWSRAAVATYTAGGAFFLGLTSTTHQIAYYSAAEQLYKGAQSLFQPISQALYPYMVKSRNIGLFKKIIFYSISLSLLGLLIGIATGKFFLDLIYGSGFNESYPALVIFMLTYSITIPSILLGYPLLGAYGESKTANMSVVIAGTFQVVFLIICHTMNWTNAWHVCLSILIVESIVLAIRAQKSIRILTTEK